MLQQRDACPLIPHVCSRGLLDAHVATVDEVEQAVATAVASPKAIEDEGESLFGAHSASAAAFSETRVHALSSSSSSDFIVLGNDSDSDFLAQEDGGWEHNRQ